MSIVMQCSECGMELQIGEEFAGKAGKCPQCGAVLRIPAKPAEAPPEGVTDVSAQVWAELDNGEYDRVLAYLKQTMKTHPKQTNAEPVLSLVNRFRFAERDLAMVGKTLAFRQYREAYSLLHALKIFRSEPEWAGKFVELRKTLREAAPAEIFENDARSDDEALAAAQSLELDTSRAAEEDEEEHEPAKKPAGPKRVAREASGPRKTGVVARMNRRLAELEPKNRLMASSAGTAGVALLTLLILKLIDL